MALFPKSFYFRCCLYIVFCCKSEGADLEGGKKNMIRKILCFLVLTLLMTTGFSVGKSIEKCSISSEFHLCPGESVGCLNDDKIDQEQNETATSENTSWAWALFRGEFAQSFVPTLPILTQVELKMFSRGNPDNLYISIRDDLNGEDLTSTHIDGELIPNGSNVNFDFDDISVTPGEKYFIIWHPVGNSNDNTYYWFYGEDDAYPRGKPWHGFRDNWECFEDASVEQGFEKIDFCFRTYGYSNPPKIPVISGSISGKAGEAYQYSVVSTEPDGDDVFYYVDWGDETSEEWHGPFSSDEEQQFTHTWTEQNTYTVKVKAKDSYGFESDWATLEVTMPKNNLFRDSFMNFLDQHPLLFSLFQRYLAIYI